mgnify:CR=1 FL=1
MIARLKIFGSLGLFWMIFFTISRLLFLLYQLSQTTTCTLTEVLTALLLGLRMDAAMTGYWLLLPGLFFSASGFLSNRALSWGIGTVTLIFLVISTFLVVVDLELYRHWGFRLNATPLLYVDREAMSSIQVGAFILLVTMFILIMGGFAWLYWRTILPPILRLTPLPKKLTPIWLGITALLFIPIRSSFTVATLNAGVVYFHPTKVFPNHVGINPIWNFFKDVTSERRRLYPTDFYTAPQREQEFHDLMTTTGATQRLLDTTYQTPNIILILVESFTANVIEPLGGRPGITPEFNALCREGILFPNFIASGDRTDKGLVSILSGYPAQPETSIIKYPEKSEHLPYLPHALRELGYHSSFLYGGDIEFANMQSYLNQAGFCHITDEESFDHTLNNSKWGVADHFVFERLLFEADTSQRPFFKVMLSLSSHEPFEVPMPAHFTGMDEGTKFLNAVYYTDKSLGHFIREARKKSWWKNTLIIITADHGHRLPDLEELNNRKRFAIPMLWLGGVITQPGQQIRTMGSQTDLANTLLNQLPIKGDGSFRFSKNLLATDVKSFAVYAFHNGYGFITDSGERVYDFNLSNYLKLEGDPHSQPDKAYIQTLFNDYNSR